MGAPRKEMEATGPWLSWWLTVPEDLLLRVSWDVDFSVPKSCYRAERTRALPCCCLSPHVRGREPSVPDSHSRLPLLLLFPLTDYLGKNITVSLNCVFSCWLYKYILILNKISVPDTWLKRLVKIKWRTEHSIWFLGPSRVHRVWVHKQGQIQPHKLPERRPRPGSHSLWCPGRNTQSCNAANIFCGCIKPFRC